MSENPQSRPPAWEPLTPKGVAAFAHASVGRLWLVQGLVALLAAAALMWFLHRGWFPVVRAAIRELPAEGEIRGQRLQWQADSPVQLAGNQFLGIGVDLNHSGDLGHAADIQVEFGRRDVRIFFPLDYTPVEYPAGWRAPFNRVRLGPWWGAWEPALLVLAGLGLAVGLMLVWTVLAALYLLPLRLIGFFENRDLNSGQSWRLAGAALMPGALFQVFAIFAYTLGFVDLLNLGSLSGLHFLIGWVYLVVSPLFLDKSPAATTLKANPFVVPGSAPETKTDEPSARPPEGNSSATD